MYLPLVRLTGPKISEQVRVNSATRAEARSFVRQALENAADPRRFESRRNAFPLLTKLGCLPSSRDEILFDNGPSVFHSLAFRMATYKEESLFRRWEHLLSQACECEGWESEYSNWSSKEDHWATKWSKFNQFLWMLQGYEYFFRYRWRSFIPALEDNCKARHPCEVWRWFGPLC